MGIMGREPKWSKPMIYTNSRSEVPQGEGEGVRRRMGNGNSALPIIYIIYVYVYINIYIYLSICLTFIFERDPCTFNKPPSLPKG